MGSRTQGSLLPPRPGETKVWVRPICLLEPLMLVSVNPDWPYRGVPSALDPAHLRASHSMADGTRGAAAAMDSR